MEKALKIIDIFDRFIEKIFLLFFLLLFLIGGYTMYDTYIVYNSADNTDLRSYKPIISVEAEEGWDMSALSKDVVAWLTVDDTTIDYPIMQGKDNSEYLNKNPFGEYSLSGSIFLDYRNSSDFSDQYSLIYGHHMEYGKMFGALDNFIKKDYFDKHRTGTLTIANKTYKIKFFAALEADGSVSEIFEPNKSNNRLNYIRENAIIFYEPEGTKLIALSTCKFPETTDRTIIVGVLYD